MDDCVIVNRNIPEYLKIITNEYTFMVTLWTENITIVSSLQMTTLTRITILISFRILKSSTISGRTDTINILQNLFNILRFFNKKTFTTSKISLSFFIKVKSYQTSLILILIRSRIFHTKVEHWSFCSCHNLPPLICFLTHLLSYYLLHVLIFPPIHVV